MFFKGTPCRGVGAIARETKSAGGYLNASTSYDHTTYFTVLPASGLETALDIQSDALRNSVIDAGELARELQVIIQEAKRKLDTASAVAYETLHEVMFDRHRIRGGASATRTAGRLTREDVVAYYRSVRAGRTIVAIVGDVDPEEALTPSTLSRLASAAGRWTLPGRTGAPRRSRGRFAVRSRNRTGGRLARIRRSTDAPASTWPRLCSDRTRSWHHRSPHAGARDFGRRVDYTPTELGVFSIAVGWRPGGCRRSGRVAGRCIACHLRRTRTTSGARALLTVGRGASNPPTAGPARSPPRALGSVSCSTRIRATRSRYRG
jgi:hypothetical protein